MAWSVKQNQVLFLYGNRGVKECQRILKSEFGVVRSEAAIKRHGNRIGASFARIQSCPSCGHVGPREDFIDHVGLCRLCNTERLIYQQRVQLSECRKEVNRREYEAALREKSKEYANVRQDLSRTVRNNGLQDFRSEMKSQKVLSPKMSPRRSERQKISDADQMTLF